MEFSILSLNLGKWGMAGDGIQSLDGSDYVSYAGTLTDRARTDFPSQQTELCARRVEHSDPQGQRLFWLVVF